MRCEKCGEEIISLNHKCSPFHDVSITGITITDAKPVNDKMVKEMLDEDKKYKRLLNKFLEIERKKVRGGSGDDWYYEQQIIDYVGKQEDFLITLIKFVEKELNEGNCKIEKLKREMEDTNKKIRGLL